MINTVFLLRAKEALYHPNVNHTHAHLFKRKVKRFTMESDEYDSFSP